MCKKKAKVMSLTSLLDPSSEVVLAWLNTRCPQKPLYHSPSSTGQGRGNMMKGSRVEMRTGREQSPISVMDKTG